MATLTTDTSIFGSNGAYDPEVFKPYAGISRKIDFSRANIGAAAAGEANYEFIALPASFVLTGVYVEELEKCTSGTITLALKSDSSELVDVSVGGSTLAKSVTNVTAKALAAGDVLCLHVEGGASAATLISAGVIKVNVIGYLPNGDSLSNFAVSVPYRDANQVAGDNASTGDIYLR